MNHFRRNTVDSVKVKKTLASIREKVTNDLKSDTQKKKLIALAVALIAETCERIGATDIDEANASSGGIGIANWKIKDVVVNRNCATISYKCRANVPCYKKITNANIVKALKDVIHGRANGFILYSPAEKFRVKTADVNRYLKEFGVNARDIRGYFANREILQALKEKRKKELPRNRKERESILQQEFEEVLGEITDRVGHSKKALCSKYLFMDIEKAYLKNGTVLSW